MLSIQKLHAGYGNLHVLKGVDIEVNPNEIIALIGPNGAGKSTVIKSVFSIAKQMKGKILFKEQNISGLKTHELIEEGICYVPQGRIVFGTMTVEENLELGALHVQDKKVMLERINYVFEQFPVLKTKRKKLAYTLSGGQQQMLAIGRALMQNPQLLLMDEPSLGLSPKLQQEMFAIIKGLRDQGIAILIVEQNAKKAIEIADRTYLLENGKIVLSGGKDIIHHKKIKNVYLGGDENE